MTSEKQAAGRASPPAISLEAFPVSYLAALPAAIGADFSGMKDH